MITSTFTSPVAAALVAGMVLLSACGSGSDTGSVDTASPGAAVEVADATFNDADVVFAQGMIPHHEQAVEMASMALEPSSGASAEVQEIATAITLAQDPEITTMTEWLQAWGQPMEMPGLEEMDGMEGHDMDDMEGHDMDDMEGMMSTAEMASLAGLSGAEFDAMWISMMIAHHRGAIAQAESVKASGSDPAVAALADQVIATQQAEVTEMQALVAG
jgi:uncharacterized protein (DUF305 family)